MEQKQQQQQQQHEKKKNGENGTIYIYKINGCNPQNNSNHDDDGTNVCRKRWTKKNHPPTVEKNSTAPTGETAILLKWG